MDLDLVESHCLDWIIKNKFNRIVIQLKPSELRYSSKLVEGLKTRYFNIESKPLNIYVSQSNTCSVDLLVTQHVSEIDGIIHIGNACLSKPYSQSDKINKPVLFVFVPPRIDSGSIDSNTSSIFDALKSTILQKHDDKASLCILYDPNLIIYATSLERLISRHDLNQHIEVASLSCPTNLWTTTPEFTHKFLSADEVCNQFGYFALQKPVKDYDCAIYLGSSISIKLALMGLKELWRLPCFGENQFKPEQVNLSRLLNRRIALVDRLRDEEELRIGVLITNPLPDISEYIDRFEFYANVRKHTLYFISMVQVIDEYKIGNFDICDAFVIINSCCCTTVLESLIFNRPIITDIEFKLACGFGGEYGGVMWPGSCSHSSEEDIMNKRRVSQVSLALVHTRNELLERCSTSRVNKWSGLDYGGPSEISGDGGVESLDIEEGLAGIASSYASEPLKRTAD